MVQIINVIKRIINHPLNKRNKVKAIVRFVKWQVVSRLLNLPTIFYYGQHSRLIMKRGQTVSTGNFYCGLFEFEEMAFVLHFLKKGDLFVDVGANVGSFTILASKEKGVRTIAFEPIPSTFSELSDNVRLNDIQSLVELHNIGLGSSDQVIKFTNTQSAINHVATETEINVIEVPVKCLDDIVNLSVPSLIKIDVEGFETEVLKGMEKALQNENLLAILIETNNSGKRYGVSDLDIHQHLQQSGFKAYIYDPFKRELTPQELVGGQSNNTVYVRDVKSCEIRLKASAFSTIHNTRF